MRPDAAAVGRIADHHVVNPPIWYEPERIDQRGNLWHRLVNRLDQQCPRHLAELGETRGPKRPLFNFQTAALVPDEPRLHPVFAGQARQFIRVERISPTAPWVPD